ncbi:hypothetical protein BH09PLA1_BH09PLA1_29090 [soil metagenome]
MSSMEVGTIRYRMLETLRHYAVEKLHETAEHATLAERHARWAGDFATDAVNQIGGQHQERWLKRLDAEHDNLRAALDWCAAKSNGELATKIVASLGRYWYRRGILREGLSRGDTALQLSGADLDPGNQSQALIHMGVRAINFGQTERAGKLLTQSLAIARSIGDDKHTAQSLNYLGVVRLSEGDYNAAVAAHNEGLMLSRKLGDKRAIASPLGNMGNLLKDIGRSQDARAALDEAMAMHAQNQDLTLVAYSLLNIGYLELNDGRPREALEWFARSHEMLVDLKDDWADAYVDEGTARCRFLLGDRPLARRTYQRIIPKLRDFGDQSYVAMALHGLGDIELADGNFDAADDAFSESLRIRNELRERRSICQAMENIARLEASRPNGDAQRAVVLLAVADATRKQMGVKVAPCDQRAWQETEDALRRRLGAESFDAAWKSAESLDTAAAVKLALT